MAETEELYANDAYASRFEATVIACDESQRRVALDRTAFYPGGGGQPHDLGDLSWGEGSTALTRVQRDGPVIWHWLESEALPQPGSEVEGRLDWGRRHLLMRTHTALHILCGVIWQQFGVAVTGGNMGPGSGRLDFELSAVSAELGHALQDRVNAEIQRSRAVLVNYLRRAEADLDPALVRTKANLVPASIDPIRVIDIIGLDKQADGGTHVHTTAEVGRIEITKTESKGRANKRIRLAVRDPG